MGSDSVPVPLAEHFGRLTAKGPVHNFHAVPWPGAMAAMSPELARRYGTLLGAELALIDGSFAGGAVDSFFAPHGPLAAAQRRAAGAFGADATFFGTEGTTASNRIALEALRRAGARILMDCAAHQSLLFAAEGMAVTATPGAGTVAAPCTDVPATAALLAARAAQGRPFDTLVLTAATYDGRRMRLDRALPLLVAASPDTALVIDEAWSALHAFAPQTAMQTALAVAARTALHTPLRAPVLVTHSAHKTMAALRQGSYLHVLGSERVVERVRRTMFRVHTTSPSWPILLSLDLARAHAEEQGAAAFGRAVALRADVEESLRRDRLTAPLLAPPVRDAFYEVDPLVVRLRVGSRSRALRDRLFRRHHVLTTYAGDLLIARVNLGVTAADLDALLTGLREFAGDRGPVPITVKPCRSRDPIPAPAIGERSGSYLIPYPPGVPLVRPGEVWTAEHAEALAREQARGAEIHRLSARLHRGPDVDAEDRGEPVAQLRATGCAAPQGGTAASASDRRPSWNGGLTRTGEAR